MLQSVTIENAEASAERLSPLRPVGAVAAAIARRLREEAGDGLPLLYVAETSRRMRDIAALVRLLGGEGRVAEFGPVDGLPGDGVPPGTAAMGGRMATLRWLLDKRKRPAAVIATAAALIRRVPPRAAWQKAHLEFRVGEPVDPEKVAADLTRLGYRLDLRVDEPGEAALRGRVVEIFPAAAPRPCRIEHEDGRIVAIRSFDPATQRSVAETCHLIVDPASEFLHPGRGKGEPSPEEAGLAARYGRLETLFDYLPDGAATIIEAGVERRADTVFAAIEEAEAGVRKPTPAQRDHLGRKEWSRLVGSRLAAVVEEGDEPAGVPRFAAEPDPFAALATFAAPLVERGFRIAVAGIGRNEVRRAARRAARTLDAPVDAVEDWAGVLAAPSGGVVAFEAAIAEGFVARDDRVAVVTLRDLVGQRAGRGPLAAAVPSGFARGDDAFRIGDAVVHLDHGVARLEGLETVAAAGAGTVATEALRLRYAGDDTLLVPTAEIGALWRYGGPETDVKLDRLKSGNWIAKRDAVVAAVSDTARRMVQFLAAKDEARAPELQPDRAAFERFCARFPFEMTADQSEATEAVLADLASGRPMDRLVCGDVGFGKTEVALRAAAAAAFAGAQVAVVAPTTVLAQQHFRLFTERFARAGVSVARLSRLADPAEIEAAKAGLADGSVRIVVGSHAVLAKDVSFAELGLVVIDEEQRFGAGQKGKLRALGEGVHVLAMTATPIPRTLQAGFVGLHEISVIATPPGRRRAVRTTVAPIEEDALRDALLAEKARGGRSYVVCPRIEDLEPMAARLRRLLPDLALAVLHGGMDADAMDDAMLAFATGEGDVLLATSIVESGLDVSNADTMVVWRADRFGLAQLHQLRGRIGRGSRRGFAFLLTDPEAEPTAEGRRRLETLGRLSDLGAGFAIAARDLDLRGAGELLGEEQAGHLALIGLSFYRRLLERALAQARGQAAPEDWRTDLNLGFEGGVPADYVPEADLRIELVAALDRAEDELALDALGAEIADRFGPMPEAVAAGFALARLRLRCRDLAVRRLDAGPKAVAATLSKPAAAALRERLKPRKSLRWRDDRLVLERPSGSAAERLAAAEALLELIE
ncbi:DEAD/DEAH box helicase [Aureimonas leprariae]|uniref:Transcription-repair-coupling factor n=1 Tax=Plantimonas leprariae TaxID=2615207 RepID=A0A7V7TUX1_9HYPH|nr:DEAD/DEAH box helicase [Aureimonas leprariae]KAB0677164.1 DEAD/DEAH box helicase [Aureimonas leprariae]